MGYPAHGERDAKDTAFPHRATCDDDAAANGDASINQEANRNARAERDAASHDDTDREALFEKDSLTVRHRDL